MSSVLSSDVPKPAANSQDMFDDAFGAPNSSPFGAPPVAMVQTIHTDAYNAYHTPSVTVFICNFSPFFLGLTADGYRWSDCWFNG